MNTYYTDLTSWIYGSSNITALQEFKSQLGLDSGAIIPTDHETKLRYLDFLAARETTQGIPGYLARIAETQGVALTDNEHILAEFRASLGLSATEALPNTAAIKQAFVYFLSSPTTIAAQAIYGVSDEAAASLTQLRSSLGLPAGIPIPTDSATFDAYLNLVSLDSQSHLTIVGFMQNVVEKIAQSTLTNDILAKFRAYLRIDSSEALPNDTATQAAFVQFLQENLDIVHKSEAVNALSPDQEAVRQVLFSTFTILLDMLSVLQKTTIVQSQTLLTYSKWETEYTNMLTSTPLYGPTVQNQIIANEADFGRTTLGYGGITVRDVCQYLIDDLDRKFDANPTQNAESDFQIYNPTTPGFPRFYAARDTAGQYVFYLQRDWNTNMITTQTSASILGGEAGRAQVVDTLLKQMTEKWNDTSQWAHQSYSLSVQSYNRDSSGNLVNLGAINTTLSPDGIKALWSPHQATAVRFPIVDPNSVVLGTSTFYHWGANYLGPGKDALTYGLTNDGAGESTNLGQFANMSEVVQKMVVMLENGENYNWGGGDPYVYCYAYKQPYSIQQAEHGYYLWRLTKNSDGTYYFQVGFARKEENLPHAHDPDSSVWSTAQRGRNCTISVSWVDTTVTGLWGPWQSEGVGAWPETVPYPSNFSKASLQAIRQAASSYRGEVNAQLQQYIQNAQAKKADIDTQLKAVQNVVTQTTQATTNQVNMLESIVQTMKSILMSIFH